jgi:hypothetical protein
MKVIADLGRCPAHHHHNDCQTVRALLARPCGDHWGDDEGEGLLTGSVDQLADGQAAADPAVVSISASPSMTSQPLDAA